MYKLIFDKKFSRDYRKLDRSLQIEGDKKLKRLKEDPKGMGKPLRFFTNLFELYIRSYRIYYLIQESEKIVLILAIEHKDEQKDYLRKLDIEEIKRLLGENP